MPKFLKCILPLYAVAFSGAIQADTIAGYVYSANDQIGGSSTSFGTLTDSNIYGSSTLTGSGTPFPSISASSTAIASSLTYGTVSMDARASLIYYFRVNGPDGIVPVNLNARGSVSASSFVPGTGQYFGVIADSNLVILGPNLTNYHLDETLVDYTDDGTSGTQGNTGINSNGTPASGFGGSFSDMQVLELQTNADYRVTLQVQASQLIQTQNATVKAITNSIGDPTFSLGSGVKNPSAYSFTFSPGIGNAAPSSAPEPGTWAGMGVGLLFLGINGRSRRVKERERAGIYS